MYHVSYIMYHISYKIILYNIYNTLYFTSYYDDELRIIIHVAMKTIETPTPTGRTLDLTLIQCMIYNIKQYVIQYVIQYV